MGVNDWLTQRAVRSAHVLLVEVPGHAMTAVAVERACAERGWRMATAPADADVLAVCGRPGPQLSEIVEALWGQVPGPRARVELATASAVGPALDEAERQLRDKAIQRRDAHQRPVTPLDATAKEDTGHEGMDHEGMDHEGMDHGDMDMAPEGIPLAQGGDDRDGLEMDVLHVRLGPVLSQWPGGLVLRCALQGDVVVEATVEVIDADAADREEDGRASETATAHAARRCHSAARLLVLAGWADGAARAHRLRNALLDAADPDHGPGEVALAVLADEVTALRRRVARSRTLRWSLRGLGALGDDDLERHRLPKRLRGDAYDRLLWMLERSAQVLTGPDRFDESTHWQVPPSALSELVTGLDLAATRLVVASLDLDARQISTREEAHV